jgi:large subunit ribosomal protein L35
MRQITPELKNLFSERNGSPLVESSRSLIKFSFKGKRKSVKAVIRRFYRLEWGAWIRPRSGRHNKLWKKGAKQRKRARTHVFCNSTRSYMLDKMVTKFWHRKKYYVDDPYESYHTRPTFWITHRR